MRTGTIIGFIFLILIIIALALGVFVLYTEVVDLRSQVENNPDTPAPEEIEDDNIVNLDLRLQRGNLRIEMGDKFSIRDSRNRPFNADVRNQTFYLDVQRWRHHSNINLTLPHSTDFENVKINIGGGILDLSALSADRMELSVGGGSITATDITARILRLECGAGKIDFDGNVTESLDIDHSVGQTIVTLDGQESDFNYDIDYAVGSVHIGDREYSGISGSDNIDNKADKNITIDSAVGSLEIHFKDE